MPKKNWTSLGEFFLMMLRIIMLGNTGKNSLLTCVCAMKVCVNNQFGMWNPGTLSDLSNI